MSAAGSFTRVSTLILDWDRLFPLSIEARYLWFSLYISPNAKRLLPGLWQGSVAMMADTVRMACDKTIEAFDELLACELVEFDTKKRLARFTELPDAGEWPSNPNILESWWSRFRSLPECGVRDAHVTTIRWLLEQGSASSTTAGQHRDGRVSPRHEEVWGRTFGTVKVPPLRRRGIRRMDSDLDTSTRVQIGLFAPRSGSLTDGTDRGSDDHDGMNRGSLSSSLPSLSSDTTKPFDHERCPQVNDLLWKTPDLNKINNSETLSKGSGEGEGEGDLGFRKGGLGEKPFRTAVLSLVPPALPFTVDEICETMARSAAKWKLPLHETARIDLQRAIMVVGAIPLRGDQFLALLRERIDLSTTFGLEISPERLSAPQEISRLVHETLEWKRDLLDRQQAILEARQQLGI